MNNTKRKPNKILTFLSNHAEIQYIFLALGLTLIMEMLCRHDPLLGIKFLAHPFVFLYNALIVYLTLTVPLYFKRRNAATLFVTLVWFGLAMANCVVTFFRTTPFSAMDLLLIASVWSIFSNYLNVFQIILIVFAFIVAISAVVYAFIKMPKAKPAFVPAVAATLAAGALLFGGYFVGLRKTALSDSFYNLVDAYNDYGFAYCFATSIFDRGINKPDEYSDEAMNEILDGLEDEDENMFQLPNIIMLQLESFFDPNYMQGLTYSSDPTPVFNSLKNTCPHAFLTVPSIGAGTANTEFEILSGMSLDYFGVGEYPYQTVLKNSTCESVCFNMSNIGYNCHAVHNHSGTFYDRNRVYSMLGFDTFTSLEYMQGVKQNPIEWAEDEVLTSCVLDALNSDGRRDFIYTISVQAHGKYPTKPLEGFTPSINVEGFEDEEDKISWEYFLTELNATDRFIGELIASLESFDEPCLVVMYGDHLPNLGIEADMLKNGDVFQTEYIVWNNYGFETEAHDLFAYQLSSYVQNILGLCEGSLTQLHQECASDEDYQEKLEMLEYDMLYGDQVCFNGHNPYEPTELQMGIKTIEFHNIRWDGERYLIDGANFTPYSVVIVDDDEYETEYVSDTCLYAYGDEIDENTYVRVGQIGEDGTVLSSSNVYFYYEGR